VIQELNQDSVRIPKIKGPRSIAMGLRRLLERDAVGLDALRDLIDILRSGYHEAEMVQILEEATFGTFWQLVNRKIVTP